MTSHLMHRELLNDAIPGFSTHVIHSEPVWYHRHTFYEVFYIISGCAEHLVNGQTQMLKAGDLVFLSTNDDHMYSNVDTYRCVRRDIMIHPTLFQSACDYLSPNLMEDLFSNSIPTIYHLPPGKVESLERKLNLITLRSTADPSLAMMLMRSFLTELLSQHLQHRLTDSSSRHPKWVIKLMSDFSNISLFKTPTATILEDYAYNVSYMRRVFKQATGMTMTDFRLQKQLDYAKSLLLSSDDGIEKIAEVCGFNNASYFYRIFKSQLGISPKKYRDTRYLELP